jgi:hypothetical protein
VYASVKDEEGEITQDLIEAALIGKYPQVDLELVFGMDSPYDTGRMLAKEFVERAGFRMVPKVRSLIKLNWFSLNFYLRRCF